MGFVVIFYFSIKIFIIRKFLPNNCCCAGDVLKINERVDIALPLAYFANAMHCRMFVFTLICFRIHIHIIHFQSRAVEKNAQNYKINFKHHAC